MQKTTTTLLKSQSQSCPWPALGRSGTAELALRVKVGDATTPSIRSRDEDEGSVWMLDGVLILSELGEDDDQLLAY